jgi:hypothetical protein
MLLLPSSEIKKLMQYFGYSMSPSMSADQRRQIADLMSGEIIEAMYRQRLRNEEQYGQPEPPLLVSDGVLPR